MGGGHRRAWRRNRGMRDGVMVEDSCSGVTGIGVHGRVEGCGTCCFRCWCCGARDRCWRARGAAWGVAGLRRACKGQSLTCGRGWRATAVRLRSATGCENGAIAPSPGSLARKIPAREKGSTRLPFHFSSVRGRLVVSVLEFHVHGCDRTDPGAKATCGAPVKFEGDRTVLEVHAQCAGGADGGAHAAVHTAFLIA